MVLLLPAADHDAISALLSIKARRMMSGGVMSHLLGGNVFNPNSPQAQAIANLFIWSLIISGIIFAIVTGGVIYSIYRYRYRPESAVPQQVAGHTGLEIAWTATPALILVVMFGFSIYVMRVADPDPPDNRPPDIVVTGHQWWWEVEYPQSGIVTANEIHIPIGKQILVRLESDDVIHDFWVPELGPKRDMIPGNPNHIWIAATKPGVYRGACAEYCGAQHAWMRILVIAQPQDEFTAWQQQQAQNAPTPAGGEAARGAQIYQQLTCVNCHAIQGGVGAAGAGPNLTHLGSRQTLGAGVIENTPENLARWIANPGAIKPGVYMPGYAQTLTDEELRALVVYLESLK